MKYKNLSKMKAEDKAQLIRDFRKVINCACIDSACNTEDFILAEYVVECLAAFEKSVRRSKGKPWRVA